MDGGVTYGYSPTYTELTPMQFSPNTEVKVPHGGQDIPMTPEVLTAVSLSDVTGGDSALLYHVQHMSESHYEQLLILYRSLPKVMFCDNITRMYSTCETNLDHTRNDLFAMVSKLDGFPVGSIMKRRVPTRTGSTVPEKLAGDIHTLLSVLDGVAFTSAEVKELLNCPKRRRGRSVSIPANNSSGVEGSTPNRIRALAQTECRDNILPNELKGMGDSIVKLKADILNIRQQYAANETARTKQMSVLKETVFSLKTDLASLVDSVQQSVSDLKLGIQRIESEAGIAVTRLKNELKQVRGSIQNLEDSVGSVATANANTVKPKRKSPTKHRKGKKSPQNTTIMDTSGRAADDADRTSLCTDNYYAPLMAIDGDSSSAESSMEKGVCLNSRDSRESAVRTSVSCEAHSYADVTANPDASSHSRPEASCSLERSAHAQYVNDRLLGDTRRQETGTEFCLRDKQSSIPVVVSVRPGQLEGGRTSETTQVDEFIEYVRKRTKRFCVKGFKSSITEGKISGYVENMGLKVTKVTIFRSRYKPVVIRLNVEDTGHVSDLEEPWFWPRGVVCRPWYSWGKYQQTYASGNSRSGRDRHHSRGSWRERNTDSHRSHRNDVDYNRSDITDYNPYLWYWESV